MEGNRHYLAVAETVVDSARELFISHLGAAPALFKESGDFATEADLAIESLMRERLVAETGIPVYGEEEGGDLNSQACWVVDPIDGTSNYSTGNPNCAILVSLIRDGKPVVAITDIPLMNMHVTCVDGSPVYLNGKQLPRLTDTAQPVSQVGVGSVKSPDSERFPANVRLNLISTLADTALRPRISGSVGVDFAFLAQGIYQAAVSISPHLWDNSAGVLLARCAGAKVTTPEGKPWTMNDVGAVAGTPRAHGIALSAMRSTMSD